MDIKQAKLFYKTMLLIRRFEEKAAEMYSAQKIYGFLHLYIGEEAVAAGLMANLRDDDPLFSTYREHGHALAKGVPATRVMAELYGKVEGCSRGRGGSMHLFDKETNLYGGSAIVGAGLPMAVGMALADKKLGRDRVTVAIFGDGAVAEGEFHESLNLAALWNLPVLFVCENNRYGMGTALELAESETDLAKKAAGYHMESTHVDGMDVMAVADAAEWAVDYVRSGKGPAFLECLTYRFRAHSMYDAELYRDKSEVAEWKQKDPLVTFRAKLEESGLWEKLDADGIEKEIGAVVDEAVAFAENAPLESVEELAKYVYTEVANG